MDTLRNVAALGQTLLQMLESRLELFGVEYRFEKARLAALVGFTCLASASFVLAGTAGIVALALAIPERHQTLVMSVVCGGFLLLLLVCIAAAVYLMDHKRTPFSETRRELRKDAECLASLMKKEK